MDILAKKSLFWDVSEIDLEKNSNFVISRILEFGDLDDIRWAFAFYGRERIKQAFLDMRSLDKKSLYFWSRYFNLENECLKNQLAKKQSGFWKN